MDSGPSGNGASPPRLILFICAANTARSVMAEHLLRRELARRGRREQFEVRSAGIAAFARTGSLVSLDTRLALREAGIELDEGATSTALRDYPELMDQAALIIAMTREQASLLRRNFLNDRERSVFTFREFAGEEGDVDDPAARGEAAFTACVREIHRLLPALVDRLLAEA